MIAVEAWMKGPLAHALGWALLHFVWEGAALAFTLAVALRMNRSARWKYGAACAVLAMMPLAFAVTVAMEWPWNEANSIQVSSPAGRVMHWGSGVGNVPLWMLMRQSVPEDAPALPNRLAPFWLLGVCVFYGRGLASWMGVRRIRRRGICAAPPEWQERFAALCARLRVTRPVMLVESCFAEAPVLVGYLRPTILMPIGCFSGLSASQVEAILIHELAHIRRHDYLINLLQSLVEGLLFYHPAVWWVSRVARTERENCCDDAVVEVLGDARAYAETLTVLEERRAGTFEPAVAATGGNLVRRIRRLLEAPEIARSSASPAAALIVVMMVAVCLVAWPGKAKDRTEQVQVPAVAAAPITVLSPSVVPPQTVAQPDVVQVKAKRQPLPLLALQSPPQQLTDQERKAKEKALRQELATPYRKWLNEDVAYIITNEERDTYRNLQTDDEREKFIEQFWLRRDPTPGTPENEFKEEHYRRIAYANEHFSNVIPGWKTDRGRIYITYGPPDQIEDHSSGGSYQRTAQEGGGTTSTYPFQKWRYKFIEGVGKDVIVEFVDPAFDNTFRMTMDPTEKDALLHMPNAALTIQEQMGLANQKPGIYLVGTIDVLRIEVAEDSRFNGSYVVLPDGTINLPFYGPVQVAGMSLIKAQEAISRALVSCCLRQAHPTVQVEARHQVPPAPPMEDARVIQQGDPLRIVVTGTLSYNGVNLVKPDGSVDLPVGRPAHVAGETVGRARDMIFEQMKRIQHSPLNVRLAVESPVNR